MAKSEEKKSTKHALKDAERTLKECRKLELSQERSLKIIDMIAECAKNRQEGDKRTHDGDYESAITYFDEVLDCYKRLATLQLKNEVLMQGMAEAWRSKGVAFEKLGKHRESSKCYKKALKIEPNLIKDEIIAMIDEALEE